MKSMNFVDNILVENTIGRIARAWDWHGVLISSERAVAHFASQINKAENENKKVRQESKYYTSRIYAHFHNIDRSRCNTTL